VVLVASSNDWNNYRHQAEVCHTYQIVKKKGIPKEQIVVVMYDNIADNENPTKEIIINHTSRKDVYAGVLKDYTNKFLTPDNFLTPGLRGDTEAEKGKGSGEVIKSRLKNHIFMYFTNHWAPGLLAFPSDKYKKIVLYIEACESGSPMNHLPNIDVYPTIVANPHKSSYACYGEKQDTYPCYLYSISWIEDSDVEDLSKETLHSFYW
ncbi:hypothetical protein AB205_0155550, partial [Aquarana catesbeiana]